ncbi:MAG: lectin [Streptosporangiaceae bacterium]
MGASSRPALHAAAIGAVAIGAALAIAAFSAPAPSAAPPTRAAQARRTVQARRTAQAQTAQAQTAQAQAVPGQAVPRQADRLATAPPAVDPAALVNPFIGTAGGGNVFPGADTPFGMLQWSPDTTNPTEGGGYSASSTAITGFSLTHMSGPGCAAAGDVPILPTVGRVVPTARDSFSHRRQHAQAGYYSVALDNGIGVQLTATTRTGLAAFSVPAGHQVNLIFKLNGSQRGDSAVSFRQDSPTVVDGSVTSQNFCGAARPYTLYFQVQFSSPVSGHGTFTSDTAGGMHAQAARLFATNVGPLRLPPTISAAAAGASGLPPTAYYGGLPRGTGTGAALTGAVGAYVSFPAGSGRTVLAKVGISYVSAANAVANLAAEDPGWNFAAVRSATQQQWNALLGKIAVTGGTKAQRAAFYTALYHSLLAPSVFSDDNGQYVGSDGAVHTVDPGQAAEYTNISGWDIYRTQAQLAALLDPLAASGAAQSLLDSYQQTGMLPRWPAYGPDSYIMVGDPADAVIADYYAFGARGFDVSAALAAMIAQGSKPSYVRPGLNYLNKLGYLPDDGSYGCCNYHGSVSTTLEYDMADFAVSALAGDLGDQADGTAFRNRARDWQNLLNPATGFLQPRLANGRWRPGFSPRASHGFVEGDSWQYTGMVPFDVAGLTKAKGGRSAMRRYLNSVLSGFTSADDGPTANMGNEPSIELPWEYDYIGEPYATQHAVRMVQDQLWTDAPDGIPGDDDLGTMSAWFVWSALGMYPMTPGTPALALGSPLFRSAVIQLPSGGALRIIGSGAATGAPYVRSATWNGASWNRAYAPAQAIIQGGTLDFRLASKPARSWAAGSADTPPSYGTQVPPAPTGPAVSSAPSGLCLELPGRAKVGSQLKLTSCDARARQQWTVAPGRIVEAAGLCMTSVPGANGRPARILLETCSNAASQRWLTNPAGELRNAATGQCLMAPRRGGVHLADATTARCNGSVEQRWTLPYPAAITPS